MMMSHLFVVKYFEQNGTIVIKRKLFINCSILG